MDPAVLDRMVALVLGSVEQRFQLEDLVSHFDYMDYYEKSKDSP
jgi:hypothetical protein